MEGSIQGHIAVLPQDVVNRIAAGEVVQKPVSAVKELLENSLDAGAKEIRVRVEGNGYDKIVIADSGCGIDKDDLKLAAVRHATSKLSSVDDFDTLQSFGFRGEALASVSMVSRLSIHSRTQSSPVGFSLSFKDGKPTTSQPKAMARKVGTTVTAEDLFYNLPNRRKGSAAAGREEYSRIVQVVQNYAILYAQEGVGFVCEKRGKQCAVDLNTTTGTVHTVRQTLRKKQEENESIHNDPALEELQQRTTKDIISQVYGSALKSKLEKFAFTWEGVQGDQARLDCKGYISHPSYAAGKKTIFVLFVNKRLVESRQIQRRLEEVYGDFANAKSRPFLFVSLTVPPNAVDVNTHPSKKNVTLLYNDEICQQLVLHCRETLTKFGETHTFDSVENLASSANKEDSNKKSSQGPKRKRESRDDGYENTVTPQSAKPKKNPSKYVRVSRSSQSGALEPFLRSAQTSTTGSSQSQLSQDTTVSLDVSPSPQQSKHQNFHRPGCPLVNSSTALSQSSAIDLSQPGAFAQVVSQCTCRQVDVPDSTNYNAIRLPRQAITRPRRSTPTPCSYTSIQSLRQAIQKEAHRSAQDKLRNSCFVGVASRQRSFLQVGEHLMLMNHHEAAKELFYQQALNRFQSGPSIQAKLGGGIDIRTVIVDLLEIQDIIQSECDAPEDDSSEVSDEDARGSSPCLLSKPLPLQKASETNVSMANQIALSLCSQSEMLEEYFSIIISKRPLDGAASGEDCIVLDALPELLPGYVPSVHGLPLFLLRLATEVEWTNEKRCFHGVCSELGSFYAQTDTEEEALSAHVQHVLFPAISTLLIPSTSFVEDGHFRSATKLSKLYRTFERC
mmetsp:Transcript_4261/g.9464  ORF Transcript_4261/g.9464 Transcript_4261/m.9464 type:complete len:842 (-) Transcript_4261:1158-3683(-)